MSRVRGNCWCSRRNLRRSEAAHRSIHRHPCERREPIRCGSQRRATSLTLNAGRFQRSEWRWCGFPPATAMMNTRIQRAFISPQRNSLRITCLYEEGTAHGTPPLSETRLRIRRWRCRGGSERPGCAACAASAQRRRSAAARVSISGSARGRASRAASVSGPLSRRERSSRSRCVSARRMIRVRANARSS